MKFSFSLKTPPTIGGQTVPYHVVLPAAAFVVVALATLFPVRAIFGEWQSNQQAITKEQGQLTQLQAKLDALNGYNDDQLSTSLTEADHALPQDKNVPGLIGGLERLAQENNLQVTGLELKPGSLASNSAQQSEMDVQLTLDGDIKNVSAFLTKLNQIRRIMAVTKVNGSSAISGTGALSTTLTLAVYTLGLPQAKDFGTDPANPLPPLPKSSLDLINKLAQLPVYTDLSGFSSTPITASASASPVASVSAGH